MTFLDELASGVHGLRVAMAPSLELVKQEAHVATLREPSAATGWWFFFFPEMHLALDPQHLALHRRDTRHHTRALFETMFETLRIDHPSDGKPRTADPTWTPLIELEPTEVTGGGGVTVIHRMTYQPTHETIMGHTLIPVAGGLFEARWVCPTLGATGLRESLLTAKRLQDHGGEGGLPKLLPQEELDAPELDASFPDHPLTRARRAKSWHVGRVEVTAPPRPSTAAQALAPLDATATLPPRFLFRHSVELDGFSAALFDRVSFSGSDGVDRLVVARGQKPFRAHVLSRALTLAANRHAKLFLGDRVPDAEPRLLEEESTADSVTVIAEGNPRGGGPRNRVIGRWFLRDGRLAAVAIVTTVALPLAELLADIDVVVQSWPAG